MLRVISGKYRGKIIPFSNYKYGMADITMQKVKEALFSIINDRIGDSRFLDLFACSGQMGIEALSRGARYVCFNEKDFRRYKYLKSLELTILKNDDTCFTNMDYEQLLPYLKSEESYFDIIFVDPPYIKNETSPMIYGEIINAVTKAGILLEDGVIVIQHFRENHMHNELNGYRLVKTKDYGTNSLSFYTNCASADDV
jgi:16S rRNA (guanine966-N2)-methyltransferase